MGKNAQWWNWAVCITFLIFSCGDSGTNTRPAAPPTPQINSITPGNGSISLKWNKVAGAVSYTVYLDTAAGVTASSNSISGLTVDSLNQSGLVNGKTYYFRVAAMSKDGIASELSREKSAVPEADSLPRPIITSVKAAEASTELYWEIVRGASEYSIYWDTASGVSKQSQSIGGIRQLSYTHTGLDYNKTYFYRLEAKDAAGTVSPLSEEDSAYTAFSLVVTATPGDSMVTLFWKAVSGADSYDVYWDTIQSVDANSNEIKGVSEGKHTHKGLINGKAYFYAVGVNIGSEKLLSSVISATPDSSAGKKTDGQGDPCSKEGEKKTVSGKSFICKGGYWVYAGGGKDNGKSCEDGEVYEGKGSRWVCRGGNWVEDK